MSSCHIGRHGLNSASARRSPPTHCQKAAKTAMLTIPVNIATRWASVLWCVRRHVSAASAAIPARLFLADRFKEGNDRVGALLTLGEGRNPAVGGQIHIFVG